MDSIKSGLLKVEVKAPRIIAGELTIVNLLITNPFSESIYIESIKAPSSSLLKKHQKKPSSDKTNESKKDITPKEKVESGFSKLIKNISISEIGISPIVAHFPREETGKTINVAMDKNSKLNVIGNIEPHDTLNIKNAEGAEVILDLLKRENNTNSEDELRRIEANQEDIASFEIQTAEWLFIKPTKLELHALIEYCIGTERKSQIIPIDLLVQPPVKSIAIGSTIGGILGCLTKKVTENGINFIGNVELIAISISGVILMAIITAIILSKREDSKGFITLEDFYGAFFVGTMIGYIGTEYFDNILTSLDKQQVK